MSIKGTVRAAVAALIVGGVTAAAPLSASAATPACGSTCLSVFSSELGTYTQPNFVEAVFGGEARVGALTGLTTASSTDPSEDFINPHPGHVSDYYALGLVSAAVDRHYSTLTASQLEYEPYGTPTGLCEGIPTVLPFQGVALRLMSCAVPSRTVFIIDTTDSPATAAEHLFPIVSGATRDFSHPFTMTYPRHVDTSKMLPPIRLDHMQFLGPEHALPATQIWGVEMGPLQ